MFYFVVNPAVFHNKLNPQILCPQRFCNLENLVSNMLLLIITLNLSFTYKFIGDFTAILQGNLQASLLFRNMHIYLHSTV